MGLENHPGNFQTSESLDHDFRASGGKTRLPEFGKLPKGYPRAVRAGNPRSKNILFYFLGGESRGSAMGVIHSGATGAEI